MAGSGRWCPCQGCTSVIRPREAEAGWGISGSSRARGKQEEARGWSGLPCKDRAHSAEYPDVALKLLQLVVESPALHLQPVEPVSLLSQQRLLGCGLLPQTSHLCLAARQSGF